MIMKNILVYIVSVLLVFSGVSCNLVHGSTGYVSQNRFTSLYSDRETQELYNQSKQSFSRGPISVDITPVLSLLLLINRAPKIVDRTLFVNPTDAKLYSLSLDTGDQYTLFGDRDAVGKVTGIRMVEHVSKEGDVSWVFFDKGGLPTKIVNAEGMAIDYHYSTVTDAGFTGVLDVAATVSQPGYNDLYTVLPLNVTNGEVAARQKTADPTGNLTINVSKCGVPVHLGNTVYVDFRSGVGQLNIQKYPAFPTSKLGEFVAAVPKRQTSSALQGLSGEMCITVADSLDKLCRLFPSIPGVPSGGQISPLQFGYCGSLGVAINALPALSTAGTSLAATLPATDKILAGCMVMVSVAEKLCGSLGYSPDPNWSVGGYVNDNTNHYLCNNYHKIKDSALGLNKVSIQAYTDQMANQGFSETTYYTLKSDQIETSAYGPFPLLSIESNQMAIDDFSITPSALEAGHNYVVSANYSCTDFAELSVARDDKEIAYTFDWSESLSELSLETPGEPLGYLDHILAMATRFDIEEPVIRQKIIAYAAPQVSVQATDSLADENGGKATFVLTRSGARLDAPLTVWFDWNGSASILDYNAKLRDGSAATRYADFTANASSATVDIYAIDDDKIEGTETVILTLSASREGEYRITSPRSATVSINDNDEEGGVCASQGLEGPEILNRNGLNWQRCDDGYTYTWDQANAYCQKLVLGGYSDWHLPTKDELKSLVACSNGHPVPLDDLINCGNDGYGNYESPTIDSQFSCRSYHYWSSSTYEYNSDNAWRVNFEYGPADHLQQWRELYVRCVR